jgi:Pyruvate/2-oxoacid:ferredoxin oxidoreductase delta subunit
MATRKIVRIDEDRCTGCGLCIPNCAEGALRIIEGKARLVSDRFCDGLGACLGHCPEDAIQVIEREAEEFDEDETEVHLRKGNGNQPGIQPAPQLTGCPSSGPIQLRPLKERNVPGPSTPPPTLTQWPLQWKLVPITAPYFEDAHLLIVADCVPFAYADFHRDFLKGKAVVVGCPKLDDVESYREKLTRILKNNAIKSVTVLFMEVPCCFGLVKMTENAMAASGKKIPLKRVKIGIQGDIKGEGEGEPSSGCAHSR